MYIQVITIADIINPVETTIEKNILEKYQEVPTKVT